MTSEPPASSDGHGDVLAELTAVLARVVHADAGRTGPERPFRVLGLDSLLVVAGAALCEHRTPALLARHLATVRRRSDEAPPFSTPGRRPRCCRCCAGSRDGSCTATHGRPTAVPPSPSWASTPSWPRISPPASTGPTA
ncbi:acyl carrier protein [Streptomyces puniciscabiei]